ncbi:MAG TPA: ATP-binding protein, partial [Chloroflexota bacterium]|nr:ATP-binding protein [Chloroflexota bacterium]
AIPLRCHDRFQGILWLGFRQTHSFDLTERNLLSTLSTQGAVLVENARLYATAESGRRRLAAVLASTSDAVIVTDQTERVLLINPATERIFGFTVDAVRNRPVADVIPIPALVQALMGQDERPQNLEISTSDGKIYNAIASTIFSHEGQVFGRVAVLRDITNLKEIDKMKSDFVATVSHDLRSPLTFIRGYTSMLSLAGELNDKQHEYVGKILGGIDQMAKMVEDLLDIARIEGGMELEQEVIDIRPLLADIAAEYWQHAHLAGIQIKVDITDDVSSIVGDLSLVRQAVANLIGNGVKYAPNSSPLYLQAHQANGEVVISVKDNGPGIAKEDQIHLFEKFYRVKARGTEKVKGSGLGLAIVKTIATRHGGNAWVQSQVGKGSTFCISLPIHESEPSTTPEV